MTRTDSTVQLAAAYTSADIFFNPTMEDNYPTVNLEAEACGTPVVTYDMGGCRETIKLPASVAIRPEGAVDALLRLGMSDEC